MLTYPCLFGDIARPWPPKSIPSTAEIQRIMERATCAVINPNISGRPVRIALLVEGLGGGGVERTSSSWLPAWTARGHEELDLLRVRRRGNLVTVADRRGAGCPSPSLPSLCTRATAAAGLAMLRSGHSQHGLACKAGAAARADPIA